MTADDDDDPKLQQLRAVWVTMRDEDPPDRGMAALMAAAREKADEMKPRESWWSRVLVTLRRPPVLALATVTVLLGGALFVAQRKDSLEATSVVDERANVERTEEQVPAVATPSTSSGSAASTTPELPAPTRDPDTLVAPAKPRGGKAMKSTGSVSKTEASGRGYAGGDAVTAPPPPPPPPPAAPQAPPSAPLRDTQDAPALQIAADDAPAPDAPKRKAPVARKPLPPIEGESLGGAPAGTTQAPTVAQLVKQCETAAAKGDCATVRTLAGKIAKSDPATYKQRIANNAAIARCLQLDE